MEQIHKWLATLRDILPQYLIDSLANLYFHVVSLGQNLLNVSLDSINLQTILPPIISLFAIYFALLSLYHTTTFLVRATIFFVKWGALIGVLGVALGYIAGPKSFSLFNTNSARRKPSRARNVKPRSWDSFDQHRQWQETQQEAASFASDAAQFAQEIMDKIVATTVNGWLGAFTSLAVEQFIRDDTPKAQVTKDRESALKKGKGRAKSR
ncbi:hypothetical protein BU17DRAFT_88988 [Hysterangium stoloniferum]|nr:hypothetical protein BU17DRAFT_88988 [Hysterangium stoloniferum]